MRSFISQLLVVSLLVTSALAQSGDWKSVEDLAPETDISVSTVQGRKYQGELEYATADFLVLQSNERGFPGRRTVRREIPRNEVKQVRLNRRFVSIAAGAAIGLGVGVGIGAAADSRARNNEDNGLIGAALGILGAVIGAGIAKSHPFIKGRIVYRVP